MCSSDLQGGARDGFGFGEAVKNTVARTRFAQHGNGVVRRASCVNDQRQLGDAAEFTQIDRQ